MSNLDEDINLCENLLNFNNNINNIEEFKDDLTEILDKGLDIFYMFHKVIERFVFSDEYVTKYRKDIDLLIEEQLSIMLDLNGFNLTEMTNIIDDKGKIFIEYAINVLLKRDEIENILKLIDYDLHYCDVFYNSSLMESILEDFEQNDDIIIHIISSDNWNVFSNYLQTIDEDILIKLLNNYGCESIRDNYDI